MSDGTKDARSIELAEIAGIMGNRSGRNVFCRLLERTGVFASSYSKDPYDHAYNAGRRAAGLAIITELQEACPGEYFQLLKERQENNG